MKRANRELRRRSHRPPGVTTAACLLLTVAVDAGLTILPAPAAELIPAPPPSEAPINLPVGMGQIVRFEEPAKSVFLADPSIADLKVVASGVIYLYGKKGGATNLIALDSEQKQIVSIQLRVYVDATPINELNQGLHPGSKAAVGVVGDRAVIAGSSRTIDEAVDASRLARTVSPAGKPPLNTATLEGSQQVNIRVRFVEVSRNDLQSLGFDWSVFAKSGDFIFGKVNVDVMIEALRRAGAINILAEPNLTAVTGQSASFLAGGESPVVVPTEKGTVTAQYKPFGVSLEFTPTLIKTNRIAMRVRPEVSALSKVGAVKYNGVDMPGFSVRRADTTVEVASGQTFAIGGLFQRQVTEDLDKVPGLSEVPILGELFQTTRLRRDETELVILVTPYLVKPTSDRLATPLERRRPSASAMDRVTSLPKVTSQPKGQSGLFVHK